MTQISIIRDYLASPEWKKSTYLIMLSITGFTLGKLVLICETNAEHPQ